MSLVSLYFPAFLAVTALVYYLIPRRGQWVWLLLASLAFYVLCSYGLVLVPAAEAAVCFVFGKQFERRKSRGMMLMAVLILIAILFVFKYAGWFGTGFPETLNGLSFGFSQQYLVPLGISYFTIMGISYLTDVYRGTEKAEQNYGKLLLFLCFFPIVTQGPILRYGEVTHRLETGAKFRYENLANGVCRMLWGFFKKLVIAERLAVISSVISEGWGEGGYTGIWVLVSVFAFSFRLYMDFSGCIDIVIGAGEVLGIPLPENFNHSYLSRTIPEFWRRWHITLGTWLRDYVMYSFTMSRAAKQFTKKAKVRIGRKAAATIVTCAGTVLVWMVYALWHDISLSFLLSGAYFAVLIILATVSEPLIRKWRKRCKGVVESVPYKVFETLRTMILSMMGAYFIFMPSVPAGVHYLASIVKVPTAPMVSGAGEGGGLSGITILGLDGYDFLVFCLAMAVWLAISRLHARKDPREWLAGLPLPVRWILLLLFVTAIVLFGKYGNLDSGSFVYQAF